MRHARRWSAVCAVATVAALAGNTGADPLTLFLARPPLSPAQRLIMPSALQPSVRPTVVSPSLQAAAALRPEPEQTEIPKDRILVHAAGLRLARGEPVAPYTGFIPCQRKAVREIFHGPWRQTGSLRLRVSYLRPEGFSQAGPRGLRYEEPGRVVYSPGEVLPERYWGSYPLYHPGDQVAFELEIENAGTEPLGPLRVISRQEAFNPSGGTGRALPEGRRSFKVQALAPGARETLKGVFTLSGSWIHDGSFEQTHVLVARLTGSKAVLGDLPQAGIVDPPKK